MCRTKAVWFLATVLMTTTGQSSAATVVLNLDLAVEQREIGAIYGGAIDPAFVPFSSVATLTFDSSWVDGYVNDYTQYDYIETVAVFRSGNQFTSGLTALLPWGPPFSLPAHIEYDRSLYIHNTSTNPGANPAEVNGLLFDERHRANDTVAMLDYGHAFALQSYDGIVYPIAPNWQDFRSDDLLAYLDMMSANQIPFAFIETAWIYDYDRHEVVDSVLYRTRATIADITIVPVPGAAWLFGGALSLLGVLKRRIKS